MGNIIICGILLSLLQSILFWKKELGISVAIFVIIFLMLMRYLMKKHNIVKNKKAYIFMIPIILLSITFFIYNNTIFQILNIIAIVLLTVIMCIYIVKPTVNIKEGLIKTIEALIGIFENIQEVINVLKKYIQEKIFHRNEEKSENARKVIKSFLCIIPIVLVVWLLLMSADTIFANLFSGILMQIENIFMAENFVMFLLRIVNIIIFFLIFSSFFINILKENTLFNQEEKIDAVNIEIEKITISILLTILNIFYLIFSIIQFTNLFFTPQNNESDYASYARQGFFQLMTISIINIAIIAIAKHNKNEMTKYTKSMMIITLVFTVVILVSAFFRMNLYESAYGYTYLRLFVYYILATEMLLILPIGLWILEKKVDILKCSIAIITTMYLILNFSNVESTIAKRNVDRYFENQEENEIDLAYLFENTGTDGIKEIKRLLNAQDEQVVNRVEAYLLQEKENLLSEENNWQEFNLSKFYAKKELLDVK